MGTEASSTDEWIELYNPKTTSIDLTNWKIAIAGDNAISLSGSIDPQGYYLLERTNDGVISDVAADYAGSFGRYGLSDSGEHLTLTDASGASIDDVDCSGGWFAGVKDKGSKASMERINPILGGSTASNWATNNGTVTLGHDALGGVIRGTPRASNSISQ